MATNFSMARGRTVGGGDQNSTRQTSATGQGKASGFGAKARRVLLGVSLLGAPLILGLAGPATAQTTDDDSSGGETSVSETSQVCASTSFGGFTLLNPETPRTPVAAMELPAGVVTITAAHAWDAYPNRVNIVQLSEIWEVEFIAADGSVVGVSAATEDVEDNVAEGHWNGSLGDTTLTAPAVGLRAHHRPDLYGNDSKNSVHASDITVCWQVVVPTPEPPTTQPPTTAPGDACPLGSDGNPIDSDNPNCPVPVTTTMPSTTTTVEAPPPSGPTTQPACPMDSDGNPVDPTDPDCPQTTTTTAAPVTTAPAPKGPSLPVTGSESTLLLLSGLWMLGAGSTMVAYSRTR